jgi:rfaE bifunctional protein nucleotidyltransferase chain/domain
MYSIWVCIYRRQSVKRIHSLEALQTIAMLERSKGKTIVFTNGCFDLIHAAHVRLLSKAKELGDVLFLALNSDNSIRELKGPTRPIYMEEDRVTVLSSLECINYIYVFDSIRCHNEIRAVAPHIYVKGKGWTIDSLDTDEQAAVAASQAKVHIIDNEDATSSDIINKIKNLESG